MACRVLHLKRCYRHEKDASLSLLLATYLQYYSVHDELMLRVIDDMALRSILLLNDSLVHRCFMQLITVLLQQTPAHYCFWHDWIFTLYAVHSYPLLTSFVAKIPFSEEVATHCDDVLASCFNSHLEGDTDEDKVHYALYALTGVIHLCIVVIPRCFFCTPKRETPLHRRCIPHKPSGTTSLRTSMLH